MFEEAPGNPKVAFQNFADGKAIKDHHTLPNCVELRKAHSIVVFAHSEFSEYQCSAVRIDLFYLDMHCFFSGSQDEW